MKSKIFQYIIITAIISAIAGAYFYFQSNAAQKINASKVNNLTSGLVGYWTFDGADMTATTALDKAGSHNGTLGGSPTRTIGKIGQALNFSSSNPDHVDITGTESYKNNLNLTFSVWVKAAPSSSLGSLYAENDVSSTNRFWIYNKNDSSGKVEYYSRINWTDNFILSNGVVFNNQWNHLAITDENGSVNIYINGVLDKSSSYIRSGSSSTLDRTAIGCVLFASCALNFNGSMDEFRIYSRALSASEITELYQEGQVKINASQTNKLTSGLVGYWTLDGQDTNIGTNTTSDKSGYNPASNGTLSGSTKPAQAIGKIGQGMNFSGSSSYIAVPSGSGTGPYITTDRMTLSAWFKADSFSGNSGYNVIAGKDDGNDSWNKGYDIFYDQTAQKLGFYASNWTYKAFIPFTNDGNWHHIVGTYDGTNVNIYLDKVAGTPYVYSGSINMTGTTDFRIGSSAGVSNVPYYFFDGLIDEVRIYNRALSASEITELYQQGQTKINASQTNKLTNGLVSHWTFDGPNTTAAAATDVVSGYNGTLTSTTPTIGKIGQALNFNGSSSIATVTDPGTFNLDIGGPLTISAWIYPKALPNETRKTILSKSCMVGNGYCMFFDNGTNCYASPSYAIGVFYTDGGLCTAEGQNIALNQWSHVVYTTDAATKSYIYVNGSESNSKTHGAFTQNLNNTNVIIGGLAASGFFDGSIDEVRVYNRVLSASEVTELYNMGR